MRSTLGVCIATLTARLEPLGASIHDPSDRDPLDEVAGDAPATTVVDLGGAGVGVPGQVLDVFERHVLAEQVRDYQDAKRVGREDLPWDKG